MMGRVLIIAGSDPSGGAGLQADIKTVTALNGYAAAAVTALTVQNTLGVKSVHPVAPALIQGQIAAVLDDIGADAVKIGMIGEEAAAHAIADILKSHAGGIPIVLDPVLVATSGDPLADEGVAAVLLNELIPMAAAITPNTDELAAMAGMEIRSPQDMLAAGAVLAARTKGALILKGGHLKGGDVFDFLLHGGEITEMRHARIESTSTHGTGCTLASAIAAGIAQKLPMCAAVARAVDYVREAIRTAPGLGRGRGPLNHAHPFAAT